jgi:hypothetical protein
VACEETKIKVSYLRPFPVRILGHPDAGIQAHRHVLLTVHDRSSDVCSSTIFQVSFGSEQRPDFPDCIPKRKVASGRLSTSHQHPRFPIRHEICKRTSAFQFLQFSPTVLALVYEFRIADFWCAAVSAKLPRQCVYFSVTSPRPREEDVG